MRLFHSGAEIIKNPDIHAGRKNADFGPGFYLSNEQDFALRWAKCREGGKAYVNIYDLDTEGLKIKELKRDGEWYDYICANRNGHGDSLSDYDVIIGPIANDTLYDVFGIPTSGLLSRELSIGLLQLGGEFHQIVIKSEPAVKQLHWLDVIEIDYETVSKYHSLIQSETENYQLQFQEYLENN